MAKIQMKRALQNSSIQNNGISSSSRPNSSLYKLNYKKVSVEEYNKILFQNQRLAKEHANLKAQLARYKELLGQTSNQKLELNQQLSAANIQIHKLETELKNKSFPDRNQISDRIKHTMSLLVEDYLAIDGIKHQINEFGNKMETIKGIMSSLLSTIETNPQTSEDIFSEISGKQDYFYGLNSSVRLSLSSQDREIRRRSSSEMIKRDFQVLSELSTILEMSRENRMSSFGSASDQNLPVSQNYSMAESSVSMSRQPNRLSFTGPSNSTSGITSIATTSSAVNNKNNTKSKAKKCVKNKTKNEANAKKETKPKKKKRLDYIENTSEKSGSTNDPNKSVYDFNEEDKENIIPPTPLMPPLQASRRSRRITRSKQILIH